MAQEKTKNDTAIAKLLRPKKEKERASENGGTSLNYAQREKRVNRYMYYCYRYIDKLCEVVIGGQ